MKINYNAPVVLTFAFLCTLVFFIDSFTGNALTDYICSTQHPSRGIFCFAGLLTHIIGHSGYLHFSSNMTLLLLLGPRIEEKHGSLKTLTCLLSTAFITGLFATYIQGVSTRGASGVIFMLIALSGIGTFGKEGMDLTFILISLLYAVPEIVQLMMKMSGQLQTTVSHEGHLIGFAVGAIFALFLRTKEDGENKSVWK